MLRLSRSALVLGLLVSSIGAQAGSNPATQILPQNPTPGTEPAQAEPSPPVQKAEAGAPAKLDRASRRAMRRAAKLEAALKRHEVHAAKASDGSAAVAKATPEQMNAALPPNEETGAPTPRAFFAAKGLDELVARHARAVGVPLKLARAVVSIESRGNAKASHRGALGLMQIKYDTARAFGFGGVAAGLLVAETNLTYGMKVLADAYKSAGGDVCGTLARYQSGHLTTHPSRANRVYCSKARAIMAGA